MTCTSTAMFIIKSHSSYGKIYALCNMFWQVDVMAIYLVTHITDHIIAKLSLSFSVSYSAEFALLTLNIGLSLKDKICPGS